MGCNQFCAVAHMQIWVNVTAKPYQRSIGGVKMKMIG